MNNAQNVNMLKKFKAGEYSRAVSLWADELYKNALNESIHKNLIQAKEHLEKTPEDNTSKTIYFNKISAIQSFFKINLTKKFRELQGEKNIDSPVSGIKETVDGDIIISDDFNHRVQVYDQHYQLKFSFGQKGKAPGEFHYPKGIDIDSEGNIYVADCWNHRIQKFTKDGKFISTFGSYGNKPAQFNEPVGISIDATNQLWVVDRCNHRIQCFDHEGNYQGSIGHRGRVVEENLAELFETPPEKFSRPSMEFPSAIAMDSKNDIYIVDSHNHRILKFDSNGKFILSFGKQGKEQGEFLYPQSIVIDQFDNIFISDLNNNRIQFFSPVGEHYFSISGEEGKDKVDSPTILACGKDNILFVGFAFNPKILVFNYQPIPQKERIGFKEDFDGKSAYSLYLSANFFHREQDHAKAIEKYEEALSVISDDTEEIIHRLPLYYLDSAQKNQKEDISRQLLIYYSRTIERLNESILNIYKERKDIVEKQIDPVLKAEKEVLAKKLPSSEIDKNLYQLGNEERTLFRKTRGEFLELKRINKYQSEMFLLLLPGILAKQDADGIKKLIEHSLAHFYQNLDLINSFLEGQDLNNSKCFEEIQKADKGSFNLREFRSALVLKDVSSDFIQFVLSILNNSIHLLAQLALQISTSKTHSTVDLFGFLTQENNIKKIGGVFYKLRYDFNAILQLKEGLKVLFSYSKLNLDQFISNVLKNRSFNIDSLLNKDMINYEKDLIELLFVEELGVFETENGLGTGLYYFNKSELDLFQPEDSASREESYTALLNQLRSSISHLLSEKKELDALILKHTTSLKSAHSGDQELQLKVTNELALVDAQSVFGNKLISEHLFLYRIIHWKRSLSFLIDFELKKRAKDGKGVEEIYLKISACSDEIHNELDNIKQSFKQKTSELIEWNNVINNAAKHIEIDKAKEIDAHNKISQLSKDMQILELFKNEYIAIGNIQKEVKKHIRQKNQLKTESTVVSCDSELHGDRQVGIFGNRKGQFNAPSYICSTNSGYIFVTDSDNHRIQKFTNDGNYISSFGSYGDFEGFFNRPRGILCDQNNNLFICDLLNHRIQKFDSSGNYIMSWGTFGDGIGYFNKPVGICQDSEGYLYVAEIANHRVQKYTVDGQFILAFGKQGENHGEFYKPMAVCCHNDNIMVGEPFSDKIQVFDKEGRFIRSVNYSKETSSNLKGTSNISIDTQGHIFISEFWNNKLYMFSEEFNLITSIGSSEKILLDGPCGVTFAGKYIFLCNYFSHRIQRFQVVN